MRAPVFLMAVVASGCAGSLSTMHPAHVAPRGHVQTSVGFDGELPTGTLRDTLDTGRALARAASRGEMLTDAEKLRIYDAGVSLAAQPPGLAPFVSVAYTVVDNVELSLRYAGQGFRLAGRGQVLTRETGPFDMVIGLGVARAATEVPGVSSLPVLKADEFVRTTVDLPILIGTSRDWCRVWVGPRLLYTRMETALRLELPSQEQDLARFEGHGVYWGAQGGFALGWRHVFLGFELTLVQLDGSATAQVGTTAGAHRSVFDTFVIAPSVGLMGEL